jgi:hypothetical protein
MTPPGSNRDNAGLGGSRCPFCHAERALGSPCPNPECISNRGMSIGSRTSRAPLPSMRNFKLSIPDDLKSVEATEVLEGDTPEETELRVRDRHLEAAETEGWPGIAVWGGWLALAAIAGVDVALFAAAGQSYPAWYLANGALLSFGVTVLSAVGIELDRMYGLISAHPSQYLASWFHVWENWSDVWSPVSSRPKYPGAGSRSVTADALFGGALLWAFRAGLAAWFAVAGPPQYLLNLICGAPARSALASGLVVWEYQELYFQKGSDGQVTTNIHRLGQSVQPATDPKPNPGAYRFGFDVKPVSATYALAALVLFVIAAVGRF